MSYKVVIEITDEEIEKVCGISGLLGLIEAKIQQAGKTLLALIRDNYMPKGKAA